MGFRLTPPLKPKLSETDVIGDCRKLLEKRGYWLRRNPVGKYRHAISGNFAEFGPPGIPDFTAIHSFYPAFFLEFKRPGAKLRPEQVNKFAEIQLGYRLAAVMVDGPEELAAFLQGHEQRSQSRSP